jgi:hypothetical protein
MTRLALAVLLAASCTPSATDPPATDPAAAQAPTASGLAERFVRFVVRDYNWEIDGYDVLIVSADGKASYVGAVPVFVEHDGQRLATPVWHRVEWQADAASVEALVRHLERARFLHLEDRYVDPTVHDGENVEYVVETKDGVKRVTFQNRSPAEVAELRAFVMRELVAPRRINLQAGTRLSDDEAKQAWEGL